MNMEGQEPKVLQIMDEARRTFEERGKVYGNAGFMEHGQIMKILFPDGLVLETEEEMSRAVLFNYLLGKFCRYAKNFKSGGHQDSIHDIGVYAFILEAFDANHNRS